MSLPANLLGIPQNEFGLVGIHVGNVISQELDKQDKGFKAQYNPVTKKITVLNTSDLPPAILSKILYVPSASREYNAWNGYYPVVIEGRDKDGNLEVEFSQTKPGADRSEPKSLRLASGSTFDSMLTSRMDFMTSSMGSSPAALTRLPNFSFISSPELFLEDFHRPSFTALHSVDLEEPVSQEEVANMTKAISDGVMTAMGQFFNKYGLADGGIWYPNDYRKYLRDEINSEMDQSFFTGYAKDEFFEKTGRFTFKLREGKKASEALMSFLNGPTVADCGNATTACYYKCILDIIGEDKFNEAFGSSSVSPLIIGQKGITGDGGPISFLAEFTDASKQRREGVFGKRPLQIGDECHFDGIIWYGNKHPEGSGGGWNVIYIGDDADGNQLFAAHGFKNPLTEREINQQFIELYNCERTFQDDQHVIAARNPRLYDRKINRFLKDSYTICPEVVEKDPERFIKGFLVGSIRNLNAKELVKLNKTKDVSLFMVNRQLATLATSVFL